MILGFDAKRAFKNNSGLGNYCRTLLRGLAFKDSIERLKLFTPSRGGRFLQYFDDLEKVEVVTPSGLWRGLHGLWRSYGISRGLDGVQLYHGLSHELPMGISARVKKIVTMHDLIVWRYPSYYSVIDGWIHRVKQRYSCKVADVVVAISEQTKRDLIDIMGVDRDKIRVIYQSCDDIFWKPISEVQREMVRRKYDLPKRYVIGVGTIEDRKNQVSIIRAMEGVDEEVCLVLVGRVAKKYGQRVYDEIAQRNLGSRVRVISNAQFSDFPALYANAIASVYVSVFEGFGIPVLESMCCDTPVITSNCSSMPEVGGDVALYVDPYNVDEIAKEINFVNSSDFDRSDFSVRAKVQCLKFTNERIVDEYLSLYSEICSLDE